MEVLYLVKSLKTPSSRIRAVDLAPHLAEHGIEMTVEALPKSFIDRRKLFRKASKYPLVVLQKRLLNRLEFPFLRGQARILGFDFDDAIYMRSASPSANPADYVSRTRMRRFRRIVKKTDFVIPANQVLANKVRDIVPGKPLEIIPSAVDCDDIKPRTDYHLDGPPILGWIGSRSTLRYLNMLAEPLQELQYEFHCQMWVIADRLPEIPGVHVEFIPWNLATQYDEIRKFDIGLMPLTADPFTEGKSSYKLLQYLATGVPAICSPVGMNVEVSGNEEYCLTATTPGEFDTQIRRLMGNMELRKQLGTNGPQLVAEKYSLAAVAKKLAAFFTKTVEEFK